MARNAGFEQYRDYAFRAKLRFDYTPGDCERFHDAVEDKVLPALARQMARRREMLGVPTLLYLPYAIFCYASPTLSVLYGATGYRIERLEPTPAHDPAADPEKEHR